MPPGTGDVQLTMAQQVPLSGAIIVSTPQDLALIDARKGLNMFRKVDVPVLGIIENMSYFVCPKCGERSDIFGHGGAKAEAEKLGIAFLGGVPLHMDIRATSDDGRPIVASSPDSVHAQIYRDIAAKAWEELQGSKGARIEPPKLEVVAGGTELSVAFAGAKPFLLSAEMLRVMSPSAEVQGHSPDQRVTVGRKRKVKIKELQAGRQLCGAHRVRRRPRHGAVRLVVPADPRPRARQALGRVPGRARPEGPRPRLAEREDQPECLVHAGKQVIRKASDLTLQDAPVDRVNLAEVGEGRHSQPRRSCGEPDHSRVLGAHGTGGQKRDDHGVDRAFVEVIGRDDDRGPAIARP